MLDEASESCLHCLLFPRRSATGVKSVDCDGVVCPGEVFSRCRCSACLVVHVIVVFLLLLILLVVVVCCMRLLCIEVLSGLVGKILDC